jgi:hypothetical protein
MWRVNRIKKREKQKLRTRRTEIILNLLVGDGYKKPIGIFSSNTKYSA